RPLFRKYVGLFFAVICVALISPGPFEIWFSYQEHENSLIRMQREQAETAALKIGQFIKEIEDQIGWVTQLPWSDPMLDERRFDGQRLMRPFRHQSRAQLYRSLPAAAGHVGAPAPRRFDVARVANRSGSARPTGAGRLRLGRAAALVDIRRAANR